MNVTKNGGPTRASVAIRPPPPPPKKQLDVDGPPAASPASDPSSPGRDRRTIPFDEEDDVELARRGRRPSSPDRSTKKARTADDDMDDAKTTTPTVVGSAAGDDERRPPTSSTSTSTSSSRSLPWIWDPRAPPLYRLLFDRDWTGALRLLRDPDSADPPLSVQTSYATPDRRSTCLHLAALRSAPPDVVSALLHRSSRTSARSADASGRVALHHAAQRCSRSVVAMLVQRHPRGVDVRDDAGKTPLCLARIANRSGDVLTALGGGRKINDALESRDWTTAESLLDREEYAYEVRRVDRSGRTSLHVAAEAGASATLMERIARLHPEACGARDCKGRTPLHVVAARAGGGGGGRGGGGGGSRGGGGGSGGGEGEDEENGGRTVTVRVGAPPSPVGAGLGGSGVDDDDDDAGAARDGEDEAAAAALMREDEEFPFGLDELDGDAVAAAVAAAAEAGPFSLERIPPSPPASDPGDRRAVHGSPDETGSAPALEEERAGWSGAAAVVRLLLSVDPSTASALDSDGRTPLLAAVTAGAHPAAVEALAKADPSQVAVPSADGVRPLHAACEANAAGLGGVVLPPALGVEGGGEEEERRDGDNGDNGGARAERDEAREDVWRWKIPIVRILCEAKPSAASLPDEDGLVPLHVALYHSAPAPVVRCLLEARPSAVFEEDRWGKTPLFYFYKHALSVLGGSPRDVGNPRSVLRAEAGGNRHRHEDEAAAAAAAAAIGQLPPDANDGGGGGDGAQPPPMPHLPHAWLALVMASQAHQADDDAADAAGNNNGNADAAAAQDDQIRATEAYRRLDARMEPELRSLEDKARLLLEAEARGSVVAPPSSDPRTFHPVHAALASPTCPLRVLRFLQRRRGDDDVDGRLLVDGSHVLHRVVECDPTRMDWAEVAPPSQSSSTVLSSSARRRFLDRFGGGGGVESVAGSYVRCNNCGVAEGDNNHHWVMTRPAAAGAGGGGNDGDNGGNNGGGGARGGVMDGFVAHRALPLILCRPCASKERWGKDLCRPLYRDRLERPGLIRRRMIQRELFRDPRGASLPDRDGRLPLHLALTRGMGWTDGVKDLFRHGPAALRSRDARTFLYPFMLAATAADRPVEPSGDDDDGGAAAAASATATAAIAIAAGDRGDAHEFRHPHKSKAKLREEESTTTTRGGEGNGRAAAAAPPPRAARCAIDGEEHCVDRLTKVFELLVREPSVVGGGL